MPELMPEPMPPVMEPLMPEEMPQLAEMPLLAMTQPQEVMMPQLVVMMPLLVVMMLPVVTLELEEMETNLEEMETKMVRVMDLERSTPGRMLTVLSSAIKVTPKPSGKMLKRDLASSRRDTLRSRAPSRPPP